MYRHLPVLDQTQFGLCNREAFCNFGRYRGSKIWYKSIVFHRAKNRVIRKLCINLSEFGTGNETLDQLTHLHISDTDNAKNVNKLVLPPNLIYCFIDQTSCLTHCTLPSSVLFLETDDHAVNFINLNSHPNLIVLRMQANRMVSTLVLPPNLVECSIMWISVSSFSQSLTCLSVDQFDIEDMHLLPPTLTSLKMMYIRNADAKIKQPHANVQHLSFGMFGLIDYAALMPTLFPKVTDLEIDYNGKKNKPLPVFTLVQKLHLKFPAKPSYILTIATLQTWESLVDLTLSISDCSLPWSEEEICLPFRLTRLTISSCSDIRLRIHFPTSLIHASLVSKSRVFNVSMSEDASLRTLRTIGNVFANRVKFPESLRSFHVTLFEDETLRENWEPLAKCVDFSSLSRLNNI